jgi:tRNA threonylcarbamoyladenosine biosynthesis protein TsaE
MLALQGVMGVGKTQLVKGLARGLGFAGEVTSPTYTLLHEYLGGRLPLYHFDAYRLEEAGAWERLGFQDYFPSDGVTVVEWPERVAQWLPATVQTWRMTLVDEQTRKVERC